MLRAILAGFHTEVQLNLVAKAALRRKKALQTEQERLAGQKFTLEAQVCYSCSQGSHPH